MIALWRPATPSRWFWCAARAGSHSRHTVRCQFLNDGPQHTMAFQGGSYIGSLMIIVVISLLFCKDLLLVLLVAVRSTHSRFWSTNQDTCNRLDSQQDKHGLKIWTKNMYMILCVYIRMFISYVFNLYIIFQSKTYEFQEMAPWFSGFQTSRVAKGFGPLTCGRFVSILYKGRWMQIPWLVTNIIRS